MQNPEARATVVISLRVRDEHEQEYVAWQREITARAREFEGFEGTEVFRPEEGVQDEWIVIYRFRSAELLAAWIDSDERRELIERGESIMERIDEHVVATPHGDSRPVTVVVSRRVRSGRETEFERWLAGVQQATQRFPGYVDSETFRPVAGLQKDWVVVFRFASAETLDGWFRSDERKRWLERVDPLVTEERLQRIGGGLGGWFPSSSEGGEDTTPAPWKMSLAVLLALYPTVMLLTVFVSPRWASLPRAVGMFLGNVISVAFLTWVGMPAVTRLLGPWLRPCTLRLTATGTLLVGLVLGILVAGFVWVA